MILYFAGGAKIHFERILESCNARNVLVSYYWEKDEDIKALYEKGYKLFIDSGGYSARKQGVEIDIAAYRRYLEKNKNYIVTAANLDVIDLEQSAKNQIYLEESYPVLPVFHYQEHLDGRMDLLKSMCVKHPYIAVGGVAGMNTSKKMLTNFLNSVFSITRDKIRVHGFGMTSSDLLTTYPFYSVDSTGWIVGGKYGTVIQWEDDFNMKTTLRYRDKEQMLERNMPVGLQDGYADRLKNNVKEMLKMEAEITRLWKTRNINWDSAKFGGI